MAFQRAEAVYNFEPTADVELQLKKGDIVTVHRTGVGDGWLEGELNGRRGLFPCSYVKMLPSSPQHVQTSAQQLVGTPRMSRRLCMDTLLAPCGVTSFSPEKAGEVFVQGREEIHVLAGPKWDTTKATPLTISVSYCDGERSDEHKVFANYSVKTKELSSRVTRNYKHFLGLYDRFAEYFPCISLPPLPVKQITNSSDVVAQETRRRRLEKFLARVARHPLLGATKIFNEFLTVNDDKDWKIGKQAKVPKSTKKIFQAPIYYVVQYPAYNVPVNQLSSIEKFCAFSELVEKNFAHIHQSYQQHKMVEAEVMSSLNSLGHDFKRFSKGLQPIVDAQHRKVQAMVSNSVAGDDKQDQDSSDEGEEPSWNWREDPKFTLLVHYLSDVGYAIQDVAGVYREHEERLEQSVVEGLAEYSSIFHTLPDLVRLHEEAMEVFNASKEKDSKKEAEEVREHCDTLSNILMAEFDHISNTMTSDLQAITNKFLKLQAEFHGKVAMKWQSLYEKHKRTSDGGGASVDGDLWNVSGRSSFQSSSPGSSRKASSPREVSRGDDEDTSDGVDAGGGGGGRETAELLEQQEGKGWGGGGGGGGSSKGEYEVPKLVVGKEPVEDRTQEVDGSHYKNWQIALMVDKKKEGASDPLTSSLTTDHSKKPCPPPKALKPNQNDYSVPWDMQPKLGPPPPPPPTQPPPEPTTTAGAIPTWYSKVTVAPDKPSPTNATTTTTTPTIPPPSVLIRSDDANKPTSDPTPPASQVVPPLRASPPRKQASRSSVASVKKQPLLPPKKPPVFSRTVSKDAVDDAPSPDVAPPTSDQQDTVTTTTAMVAPPPPKPPHVVPDASGGGPGGPSKAKTKELLTRLAPTVRKPPQRTDASSVQAGGKEYTARYVPEKDTRDSSGSAVVVLSYGSPGYEDGTGDGGGGGGGGGAESKSNVAKYGVVEDGGGGSDIV